MTPSLLTSAPVVTVPRLWPGETVVCIATGPSLTAADVDACRGRARVIAVNNAHELAPWADVLYAHDRKWWGWHKGVPGFTGLKYAGEVTPFPDVQLVGRGTEHGLSTDPRTVNHGNNSGYQAIGMAVHFGAARILLLGYDMQGGHHHFFGTHPDQSKPPFEFCLKAFATLPPALAAVGVDVINCTRRTALTVFPQMAIEDALS